MRRVEEVPDAVPRSPRRAGASPKECGAEPYECCLVGKRLSDWPEIVLEIVETTPLADVNAGRTLRSDR
ncbi:MAG TPA: hypothetical protein VIF62_00180 [Labilithrix sp.]